LKIVIDTNVVMSGLLWGGPPNQLLKWARDGVLEAIGCEEIIEEIRRVLKYKKFVKRISNLNTSPGEVVAYFMNLVRFVPSPDSVPNAIPEDPFDNIFLALAFDNDAVLVVSGDKHLLNLEAYKGIQIVSPGEATTIIETLRV
jgi:putative PIN family toxin of toxin-antitoxin system